MSGSIESTSQQWDQHVTRCLAEIAGALGIPPSILASRRRSRGLGRARAIAAAYLQQHGGLPLREIARALGRGHTSQAHMWIATGRALLASDPLVKSIWARAADVAASRTAPPAQEVSRAL